MDTKVMAEEIANLVVDKSYWGDQWFLFFCLLIVGLVAAISSWGGSYLSTRAQNSAMRADFQRALEDLEEQTKAVKRIEEEISHNYLEQREVFRIKREKIEYLYLELEREMGLLGHNFRVVVMDSSEEVVTSSHNVEMMLSLYFKNELGKELQFYRGKKNELITKIKDLAQENLRKNSLERIDRLERNSIYIKNFNQAKINIELGLETIMENLTSVDKGRS